MAGAISRGLNLSDFKDMTIGQIVDYCIEYNDMQKTDKKKDTKKARQEDFDNF